MSDKPLLKLNLGSGLKPISGYVNVDMVPEVRPDVVHNLDVHHFPFADNSCERVVGYDVVEHVADMVAFHKEVWRICAPGSLVCWTTPHFSCRNAFSDPTHRRYLSMAVWDFFKPGHSFGYYGHGGFEIVTLRLMFKPTLMNKLVHRLANRWPERYEFHWAGIFPAWYMYVEMRVLKTGAGQLPPS